MSPHCRIPRTLLRRPLILLVGCCFLFTPLPRAIASSGKPFPLYPSIKDNVAFWEKIYATYSVNSAVIHDRDDLSKIYEVVPLVDQNAQNAGKTNERTLRHVLKNYQSMLLALSRGKHPSTAREKRAASMFRGPDAARKMAQAAQTVRAQNGLKERFVSGVIRSGAYIAEIRAILRAHGLPTELAYLPHVESSFNPKAFSKFGAAGIWQFTRATGKQYLQIDDAIDERRDPLLAADGAARYLKHSYRELGSWPLALTAYNYGLAGTLRAQEAMGGYEKIYTHYDKGNFGFASRNFYSEFLAAMHVAQRLEKNHTVKQDKPRDFLARILPGYVSLRSIERHFHVSRDTLRELNPALRPPVFEGSKLIPRGYALRLPRRRDVSRLLAALPHAAFHSNQFKDATYQVRLGDTAGGIALKYSINLKQLIAANGLSSNAAIYIGQHLIIPGSSQPSKPSGRISYLAARTHKEFAAARPQWTTPVSTPASQQPPPVLADDKKHAPSPGPAPRQPQADTEPVIVVREGGKRGIITVRPEETLALYSSLLQVPQKHLLRLNNLSRLDSLRPGQNLTVPYTKVSAAEFADARAAYSRQNQEDFYAAYTVVKVSRYRIKPGDTLWDLCNKKFNIPLWLLKKYNTALDMMHLHPDQELAIPLIRNL